ncbi:hypothetical protein [Pseudomonas sp. NPDC007930]|uniref:hypothetical protein n=1 Tax=Pseudomonas sp. NPDC007930 TaxID=3364417 RepID=UPI0036ECDED5
MSSIRIATLAACSALSLAAHGACEVHLSQRALDYGALHPPAHQQAWQGPAQTVQVTVRCTQPQPVGFVLAGDGLGDEWAFGGGSVRLALGEAWLDGQPVALLRRAGKGQAEHQAGTGLRLGDTWLAASPGQVLQVQLFIEARLPAEAWQARDRYQARGELLIRAL